MLIAVIGTRQSGKSTVEEYLVSQHGFTSLRLDPTPIGSRIGSVVSSASSQTLPFHVVSTAISIPKPGPSNISVDRQLDPRRDGGMSFLLLNSPTSTNSDGVFPTQQQNQPIYFLSTFDMLDHATRHWNVNYVTTDIISYDTLQDFIIRPFFLLVSIDAPVLERFSRVNRTFPCSISLEQFLRENDREVYGYAPGDPSSEDSPLQSLDKLVNIRIINSFQYISEFHAHLDSLNLLDHDRLRPQWDTYFMHLASLASMRSNCMKRRVGAILVRNNRILATGYNGTARGLKNCNEGGCARCNSGGSTGQALDECICLHAEENALLEAGRDRIGDGTTLYCNTCPCLRCSVKIIQVGVKEVVYHLGYKVDEASAALFAESRVTLRRHAPPP